MKLPELIEPIDMNIVGDLKDKLLLSYPENRDYYSGVYIGQQSFNERFVIPNYNAALKMKRALEAVDNFMKDVTCICDKQHDYECEKCDLMGRINKILEEV